MLEMTANKLIFSFPEIHPDARLTVMLHRTFRIPDDGKEYPLPPSCGLFPVRHVDDFADKVPQKWVGRGGVMVPLYQSEAMWLAFEPQFSSLHNHHYPFAIKVATGKVSAMTGKKWSKKLKEGDYMVSPGQPWLDGYVVDGGTIRQFVAAPLGLGVTVEEQVTGEAEFGGLQIEVVPMDPERFAARFPKRPPIPQGILRSRSFGGRGGQMLGSQTATKCKGPVPAAASGSMLYSSNSINVLSEAEARAKRPGMFAEYDAEKGRRGEVACAASMDSLNLDMERSFEFGDLGLYDSVELSEMNLDMGMAPGGKMQQQVFKDPWGIADWSKTAKTRCYVHMCNSLGWQHLTGQQPPTVPFTAAQYAARGLRWFSYYEDGAKTHLGTETTKGLESVAEMQKLKKIPILPENQSVTPGHKVVLKSSKGVVRDGVWK